METQDAPRAAVIYPIAENTHRRHILILDEDGQDGAEAAESIAAELERAVAVGPGEGAWT